MNHDNDFFEVKIPFSNEHPLELADLQRYFSRLEEYFAANGIELEIYEAQVGSFIPKFRQVVNKGTNTLLTLSTIFSNLSPILTKVQDQQPLTAIEQKNIQPFLAINSTVVVQNVNVNGKSYNTSSFVPGADLLNPAEIEQEKPVENIKKYESQELVFTKIDTNKNNICAGIITEIDANKTKKVVFISQEIKDRFEFANTADPFKHVYIVDVNVYYNDNGSIAKYEIINLIDSK